MSLNIVTRVYEQPHAVKTLLMTQLSIVDMTTLADRFGVAENAKLLSQLTNSFIDVAQREVGNRTAVLIGATGGPNMVQLGHAYAAIGDLTSDGRWAEIAVMVRPQWQNYGVATALVRGLEDHLRDNFPEVKRLTAYVSAHSGTGAKLMLTSLGFRFDAVHDSWLKEVFRL